MTDVLKPIEIDGEMVAGFEIQRREREFASLIKSPLHEVDEQRLSKVRSKVAEALHEQWVKERRSEGATIWFRPSRLNDEEITDLERKIKSKSEGESGIKPEQTRMGTNKRGESEHQIDILNIPFTNLTPHWQGVNISGATRAAAIVNESVEQGNLDSLKLMARSEHEGWVLDKSNIWKLEDAIDFSTDSNGVRLAAKAIEDLIAGNRTDRDQVLELAFIAAESIVIPDPDGTEQKDKLIKGLSEAKMQFGRFADLSKSEQLKDIDRIMVALRAIKDLQ